jgi:hypothetical protein
MMKVRAPALMLFVATGLVVGAAEIAAADCSGPSISVTPGVVEPGDTITVRGSAWGDNCYDSGPPPEGQGFLGRPARGIEIWLVTGNHRYLLAHGDADTDYQFVVEVIVPFELRPGEKRVLARLATSSVDEPPLGVLAGSIPLVITGSPQRGPGLAIVEFGPAVRPTIPKEPSTTAQTSTTTTTPSPTTDGAIERAASTTSTGDSPAGGVIIVSVLATLAIGAGMVIIRRGRTR